MVRIRKRCYFFQGFFGDSQAAAIDWDQALTIVANAAVSPKLPVPRDALLLEGRSVPSGWKYLDTIRQTRLALLPK